MVKYLDFGLVKRRKEIFILLHFKDFIYLLLETGEGGKYQCAVASPTPPNGEPSLQTQACALGGN